MRLKSTPDRNQQQNDWQPPADLAPRELLVVAATEHFFGDDYGREIRFPESLGVDLGCTFSNDRGRLPEADALWFHGPSIRTRPEKTPGQKWILMSMESDENYPFQKDPRIMRQFDLHMTYRLDSDIPALYPNWSQYGSFLEPPLDFARKSSGTAAILWAASNPVRYRDDYVSELMQHIRIDSIGHCLHNLDVPGISRCTGNQQLHRESANVPGISECTGNQQMHRESPNVPGISRCTGNQQMHRESANIPGTNKGTREANSEAGSLIDLMASYKFYLVLENSLARDYVTEKIFMALAAGTVPVYLGASNIGDFLPASEAAICAADFSSPADLAAHLHQLANDAGAYARHLEWKREGYSNDFRRLVDLASIDPLARMFIKLAHDCDPSCPCGGRLR